MSSWLTWARVQMGVVAPPAPQGPKRPAAVERKLAAAQSAEESGESQEVRLQILLHAQEVKLEALREEIKDLNLESVALVQQAQHPKTKPNERAVLVADAKTKLSICAERRAELAAGEKKMHNLRGQLSVLQTANANFDHAILIQQGANELEGTVAAMQELQVEDNVDRLRDAAAEVHNHSAILGEDMGLSGNPMAGAAQEYLVDEELEALMRAQHDEQMDALLGQMHPTPSGVPAGASAVAPTTAAQIPDHNSDGPLLATALLPKE